MMPEIYDILSEELAGYEAELAEIWSTDLAAVNTELDRIELPILDPASDQGDGGTS